MGCLGTGPALPAGAEAFDPVQRGGNHKPRQMLRQPFNRLVPPAAFHDPLAQFGSKPLADDPAGIARHNGKGRHVPRHHGPGADDRAVPDPAATGAE